MNSAIQKIIDKLRKYPDIKYEINDDSITIAPKDDNGFHVTLEVGFEEFIVWADSWHEHFKSNDEKSALQCFGFLLGDNARLRIEYRGKVPKRWTLEAFQNGKWVEYSTTGLFSISFWKPIRIEYFQNRLLKINES